VNELRKKVGFKTTVEKNAKQLNVEFIQMKNCRQNKIKDQLRAQTNRLHRRRLLSRQLSKESRLVSGDSMAVLAEFEKLK
jgi:hypothetical protein